MTIPWRKNPQDDNAVPGTSLRQLELALAPERSTQEVEPTAATEVAIAVISKNQKPRPVTSFHLSHSKQFMTCDGVPSIHARLCSRHSHSPPPPPSPTCQHFFRGLEASLSSIHAIRGKKIGHKKSDTIPMCLKKSLYPVKPTPWEAISVALRDIKNAPAVSSSSGHQEEGMASDNSASPQVTIPVKTSVESELTHSLMQVPDLPFLPKPLCSMNNSNSIPPHAHTQCAHNESVIAMLPETSS